jgi:hypothetical protein
MSALSTAGKSAWPGVVTEMAAEVVGMAAMKTMVIVTTTAASAVAITAVDQLA